MKNVFFMLVLFCLSVGIISSCSSDEEVATATTASASASAAITGETMSVGSTDYTRSLMSSCKDADLNTDAGVALYVKKQFWVYDNKSARWNENYYSDSTCATFPSSFAFDSVTYSNPIISGFENASIVNKDANWGFDDSVIKDNSSNVLDNATYYVVLYDHVNCGDEGETGQGYAIIYPKSASEIQMAGQSCTNESSSVGMSNNFNMEEVYTTQ